MGFLKKLLGEKKQTGDPDGIYFFLQCGHCGEKLRVRADKRHDLQRDYDSGRLTWRKEIMDARCFRIMYATVVFDASYRVQTQEVEGQGRFISEEEYRTGADDAA